MQLSTSELDALLHDLESDGVERKASASDLKKIRQAICAFANDLPGRGKPGVLFVGVRDDGSCADLPITDQLLRTLGGIRDEGQIQPLPSITVEKHRFGECEVAVMQIQPSSAPPVRFKGKTWIRIGPRRAVATPEEERRRAADLPFDLQPLPSASLDDLDLDLFQRTYLPNAVAPEVLGENQRTVVDQLQALRFADRNGRPTVLGLLVLGKYPRSFIAGDYIQFVRFDGIALTDAARDQKEIDGPMPELLRRLDEVMESHNTVALERGPGPIAAQRPEYPLRALQQLVRNAVLHRNYEGTNAPVKLYWFSDRIEIHSPGGPFGQVTVENFGQPGIADYRNPHLAEALKVLGYAERFGVGIPIARQELEQNGNPPPEFNVQPSHVLVTVERRP